MSWDLMEEAVPSGIVQNIVLAALQGFSEIFPVSSTAHLLVFGTILGQQMSFEKVLLHHLGTFFAILYYYRRDVAHLITGKAGWALPCRMVASFAATALVGFVMKTAFVDSLIDQPQYVAALWGMNGLIIAIVGVFSETGYRKMTDLSTREYVLIGIAQGLSALPGISRLGLTLGAGLLARMSWFEALKLSFILSLPTIFMANLFRLVGYLDIRMGPSGLDINSLTILQMPDVLPILVALSCGLLAIRFLSNSLGRRSLIYFGLYCLVGGSFFWFFFGLA